MSDIARVMARLGLRPPPPPAQPPPFLEEQTPAAIASPTQIVRYAPISYQEGQREIVGANKDGTPIVVVHPAAIKVPVTGPVTYGEVYYNVDLGLDPAQIGASVERLIANVKRMRRDALGIELSLRATPEWPLFRLAP